VRRVSLTALGPIAVAAVVNALMFSDRLVEHLATLILQGSICALAAGLTWHRRAERWAAGLAVGVTLAVGTVQFWAVTLAARDVDVMLSAIIATMVLPTLVFPWGVGSQAVVTAYVAGGYLLLPEWSALDAARVTNILIGMTLGVTMSVVGALLLDRQRRATFVERKRAAALAQQQEMLLDVGRQLNATVDVEELVTLIPWLGQRLVDCDVATLTLHDEVKHRYPVVVAVRDRIGVLRYEFPEHGVRDFADALARRNVIEIAGGTEFVELQELGARYGVARMLVVAVQRSDRLLGILSFNQRAAEPPFAEQSIRLAEGIAHQAAIALVNARLVEDLRRASRVKSEFVSTMSHELRTPLNVILGFAEMGRDPEVGPAERDECLAKIDTAGRDLLELVESTLAIGRLDAGRDEVQLEEVSLPAFWAAAGATCQRLPRRTAVALAWQSEVVAVPLVTDPRKLAVILRNLVGNALKFTEAGRVTVRSEADGEWLRVAVTDTGIGIRAEDQATVFEMFRQADGSDSRRFGGTGLGLYIVRQYVQQLGGTIALDSTPGRGSVFTVSLPLRASGRPERNAA
jgi:signal transduction histidine kinase